jgi:RHS repeat-associated protein
MPVDKYACLETQIAVAAINGRADYEGYIEEQKNLFRQDYVNTCSAANAQADLRTQTQNYHYTLYYYDQADNLVRTVPPEGVSLLTGGQLAQVAVARLAGNNICTYAGPTTTNVPLALQVLSNVLSYTGASAIETWLYNPGGGMNHFVETTTDKHWLYQFTIRKNKLGIDIYPMTAGVSPAKAVFNPKSRHYRVTIPNTMLPLADWTHVVVQSASGIAQSAVPQIWFNGVQMTVTASVSPLGSFKVSAVGGVMQYPDSLSTLKHMRIYGRLMSAGEIWDNANNNCFMPDATDNLWYRFNIPAAGGPTTIAANSTVETRCTPQYPDHTLRTTYAYNSTNQVVQQNSPDGGTNRFWYDLLSRLRISQNDKQGPNHDFSYTSYDQLGRITEVGQTNNLYGIFLGLPDYVYETNFYLFNIHGTNSQITHTYYDAPVAHSSSNGIATVPAQHNLRKRVAASTYADTQTGPITQATYYDYDLDGNVKTLYQQIAGLYKQPADTGLKKIDYEYDLISGKVNFVRYQHSKTDHFYYKYNYDSDNRLTDAWTGKEAIIDSAMGSDIIADLKKLEAHYDYYLHGPLARTETGDQYGKVQGTDYAYTLQGWIKGVNGQSLNPNKEMGKDGRGGTGNNHIARDGYAYSLGYYTGDYKPIKDTASAFAMQYHSTGGDITGQSLYNGNISNRTLAISNIKSGMPVGYTYRYDQLNRIKQARQHTSISGTNWNSGSITNAYAESYTYDGNGNLLTQIRNGGDTTGNPLAMDNLSYRHNYDSKGRLTDNRLPSLKNNVSNTTNNYTYDAIGNRISDTGNGITNINWTVYGKIDSITKSGSNIKYRYNTTGQRVAKTVGSLNTYYVRDAQGNTLALYSDSASSIQHWKEQHLYGSSRLGIWTPGDWGIIGNRHYELSDHRGNVVATITDRRLQAGSGTTVDHFIADVATASDTYSFGFEQPGRQYGGAQKYGYNGKENDDEIASENYGMREYDKQGSVFWSVDPLTEKFTDWSPYTISFNNPINLIDADGQEPIKPLAGTIDGFVYFINNFNSKMGTLTGSAASNALLRMGKTELQFKHIQQMRPLPAATAVFNNFQKGKYKDRYIYTKKGGWIDMAHFMFYAGRAFDYKQQQEAAQKGVQDLKAIEDKMGAPGIMRDVNFLSPKANMNPVSEAVKDGFHQELTDKFAAKYSADSYEDLPSDKFGAEFGAKYFDPKSKLSFGEQLKNYFNNVLQATNPENAPNYKKLPEKEPTDQPSRTNNTTTGVYTQKNP